MAILNEEASGTRDAEAGSAGRGLPAFPWNLATTSLNQLGIAKP
jgi:hypothetical protein